MMMIIYDDKGDMIMVMGMAMVIVSKSGGSFF